MNCESLGSLNNGKTFHATPPSQLPLPLILYLI